MAIYTLTLPEILAMMETVEVPAEHIAKFEQQAKFLLDKRAPLTRDDNDFQVGSGYNSLKGRGHVSFKTGTVEHQMEPKKAKQIGHWLIEAAEAAINDTVVMEFIKLKVGINDTARLSAILLDLRAIRQGSRDTVYEN